MKRHSQLSRRSVTQGLLAISGAMLAGCSDSGSGEPNGSPPREGAQPGSGAGATPGNSLGAGGPGSASGMGDSGTNGAGIRDAGSSENPASSDAASDANATGSNGDAGASADAGTPPTPTGWASGGTKSMTGAAAYPNPFGALPTVCMVLGKKTEGPCTEAADQVRKDISEGYSGIPMRLALRFLDASCKPLVGAKIKVWHTHLAGSYSGNTPNNAMCLKDQADSKKHYFRGAQTTDAGGVVAFDSCFPGWYPGRTIHIHITVTLQGKSFTSQVIFDQALTDDIFTTHAEYKKFGKPDTKNTNDGEVSGSDMATYLLKTARMQDGAMLASKDVIVKL
jgi:protocatechuate 3,4-dioxygenase beta subunit